MINDTKKLLPVLFGFFVMGFCDVVGIATSYVKTDFGLSESVSGFIPSMVFLWFLILSVPASMLMNRVGRKRMVLLSEVITFVGMLLPFIHYDFVTCMAGFVLLGIGNTIIQVSLNPLLTNIVDNRKLTSALTAGQVVKAVSAFCGPLIAAFAANTLGSWKYLFPIYAIITLVSTAWLMFTPITESHTETKSGGSPFSLLKDRSIFLLFLGIFFIVGLDVGLNTAAPKLLIERCGHPVETAGLGSSVYFVCRTAGALLGTIFLARMSDIKFFRINIAIAVITIAGLLIAKSATGILILVGLSGFLCSSVFSIIYSQAMKKRPDKANEISGLMIVGVFGGAVIPPAMGLLTDAVGSQNGSVIIILICALYLAACAFGLKNKKSTDA